jgi:Tol biopolymer transport system component
MNKQIFKASGFSLLFAVIVFLSSGCGPELAEHTKIAFSPDGKYIVFISNQSGEEVSKKESILLVRASADDKTEPSRVYSSPDNTQIYSVFWKRDRIVVFESGEKWACPDLPEDYGNYKQENIPKYDISIVSIPADSAKAGKKGPVKLFGKWTFACWDPDQSDKNYAENTFLEQTNISSARKSETIIFENFDKSEHSDNGLFLLDVKTGNIEKMMQGRNVRYPSISEDGKKIALYESGKKGIEKNGEKGEAINSTLKVYHVDSKQENEVTTLTEFYGKRPVWSKDGKFFFFVGISNVVYTTECDRFDPEKKYSKLFAPDEENKTGESEKAGNSGKETANDIVNGEIFINGDNLRMWDATRKIWYKADINEAAEQGLCRNHREKHETGERDEQKYSYKENAASFFTIHKYYDEYGIAVRLLEDIVQFTINPVEEEILVRQIAPGENEPKNYLVDYSGKVIREVNYEYVENYTAVDANGNVADTVTGELVPVLLNAQSDKEELIIVKKQDKLALARYQFERGNYIKAKDFYEQYQAEYGLPENVGDRLLMIATYRWNKDYDKMMALTRKVPLKDLQIYFSVTGNI